MATHKDWNPYKFHWGSGLTFVDDIVGGFLVVITMLALYLGVVLVAWLIGCGAIFLSSYF